MDKKCAYEFDFEIDTSRRTKKEARAGIEPTIEVLQTSALPLGYLAFFRTQKIVILEKERGESRNRTYDGGFADLCLTTWLPRQFYLVCIVVGKLKKRRRGRESNPRIEVLQTSALPLGHLAFSLLFNDWLNLLFGKVSVNYFVPVIVAYSKNYKLVKQSSQPPLSHWFANQSRQSSPLFDCDGNYRRARSGCANRNSTNFV